MTLPPTKQRRIRRFLLTTVIVVFVILPSAGAGFLYFACIKPSVEQAEAFDLSRLVSPELPPDALHRAIPIRDVPPHVIKALVSREDPRFYQHSGIDYIEALRDFLRHAPNNPTQGTRTITQQLALMAFDLSRHANQHLLVMALARRIERHFSKNQIFECYLNRVFLGIVAGKPIYGIEAGSLAYFDAKTSTLPLEDGAMLIGLIRSPTILSPYRDACAALAARNEVLHRMAECGYITKEELKTALKKHLQVKSPFSQSPAP